MRRFLFLLATGALLSAQPSADEIVAKALARDKENWLAARNYTFLERQVQRTLGNDGDVKSTRVRTYDITMLDGSPYRRQVAENDKPLSAKRQRVEEEKLRKSIEARRNETPEQKKKRLADEEKERARQREFTGDIPVAFHLKVTGSDKISGRDCWVIDGVPKQGYRPRHKATRIFPHIKGRLWIDKETFSLVRGEAEVIDTVSYGLFLARIHPGTKVLFEQTRVNDEVWLPQHIYAWAAGRLGLVKKLNLDVDIRYQDYKKFQTDSRIVSTAEVQ